MERKTIQKMTDTELHLARHKAARTPGRYAAERFHRILDEQIRREESHCTRCATKWFIAYSEGDCQESDAAEISALFSWNDDMLDGYPVPVRASSRTEAAQIAKQWAGAGPRDDIGDLALERSASSRTCWIEKLR